MTPLLSYILYPKKNPKLKEDD